MTATRTFRIEPVSPDVLAGFRAGGRDGLDHPITPHRAEGGEPLRCCLRRATAGETIAVISYSPTPVAGPWQEFGPVYVHPHDCGGPDPDAGLPADLRTGPCVLRSYRLDGTLHHDAITVVPAGADIESALADLVARDDVREVHVRTLEPQCFLFTVRSR